MPLQMASPVVGRYQGRHPSPPGFRHVILGDNEA